MDDRSTQQILENAAEQGADLALADLFERYRSRLRRMVDLRMDRRLLGRIDASDVVQEGYIEARKAFPVYLRDPQAPFYIWLRCIVGRRLMTLHRRHLGAGVRDARREVALDPVGVPEATSAAIAAQLVGQQTSPSEAVVRKERSRHLREALDAMDPTDREVLVLRHFEQLGNVDVARVLGIERAAASKRYVRALKRLRQMLESI